MSKKIKPWVSTIEEEVILKGDLAFEQSVIIKGRFEGKIKSKGTLTITSTAKVNADIEANIIIVGGRLAGDCLAHERLELLLSSNYRGRIKARKLKIEDGVKFQGKCEMIR